jgi:hypothetical protein
LLFVAGKLLPSIYDSPRRMAGRRGAHPRRYKIVETPAVDLDLRGFVAERAEANLLHRELVAGDWDDAELTMPASGRSRLILKGFGSRR